jgi:hypothetical protein
VAKEGIRLEYSGYVIFASKMISVATGLIFQFMIARATSVPEHAAEYGLWFNINDVATYFTLLAGVLPFWAMRFAARRKEGAAKTGLLANLTIAIIAALIYLPLVPLVTSALGISEKYVFLYFIISSQIIELHLLGLLEACLQARTPQTIGYGWLIQQFCKVILGYVLIMQLHEPLLGAVIATMVAFVIQIAYYFRLLAGEFRQKVRWEYVREWLKGSVVNIYSVVGNQMAAYIFIMLFAYGGDEARGRYGAAIQVANVITYASYLGYALYPKLLAERKREDITTSLKMVLMFAIPMTAGAIALSNSYITILKPEYWDTGPVLVVLAIDCLVGTVSGLFSSVLLGVETVDETAKISFEKLAKSRLLIAFSLPYLHSAITLPTTFYVLTTYTQNQPMLAALCISIINSAARFATFLILYAMVRKMIKIDIPWTNIAKYVFASAVMATILFIIPHPTRISLTLGETAIGGIVYLTLLMAIDKHARAAAVHLWQEIKNRLKRTF